MREQALLEGREPKGLVYARPDDDLGKVVAILSANKCSMAPILSCDPLGQEVRAERRERGEGGESPMLSCDPLGQEVQVGWHTVHACSRRPCVLLPAPHVQTPALPHPCTAHYICMNMAC